MGAANRRAPDLAHAHLPRPGPRKVQPHAARRHPAGLRRPQLAGESGDSELMTENMTTVFHSIAEIPAGYGPSVVAIGNFDGVHLGHQEILSAVVRETREQVAHSLRAKAVAITFDPHPEQFLRPSSALRLLTPIEERLRLLALTGIDAVVVLPFDAALASLTAREFVRRILVDTLAVRSLH